MKILFIVNVLDLGFEEPLGILSLSAAAKKKGHKIYVVENDFNAVEKKIKEVKPDFLAISVLTPNFSYMHQIVKEIRARYNIPTLAGGPHGTYFPEIIQEDAIDYVFRGESDIAFPMFLDCVENSESIKDIPNLVYMDNDEVKTNQIMNLVSNLDSLPFPDRELFIEYKQFYKSDVRSVMASRGCPYSCSYCFNNEYQEIYKGLGERLRVRSVDNVVAECKELKEHYGAKMIHFFDDIFPFKKEWVEEFSEKYNREVKLPFLTNTSFNVCSEHYLSNLSKAGCKCLLIGVETGNEYFREKILFRKMKNKMMIEKAKLIHSYGIKIYTQNLVGIPHGSLELDIETLKLNIKLKADYAGAYLCQPYPRTPIEKIARESNLLEDGKGFNRSFYYSSNLKIDEKELVERLRIIFSIIVNFPFLLNFVYLLLKMPITPSLAMGKLLHGYKIRTIMLTYKIGFRKFIYYLSLFFRRQINRMVVFKKGK